MTAHAYYRNEREEFKDEFKMSLVNTDITILIIKKLLRHYKLDRMAIYFTSGRNHSCAGRWTITINKSQMNFAVVCHELAHVMQAQKYNFRHGDKWHTKKHKSIMTRIIKYCKRKKYFENEIEKRIAKNVSQLLKS